MPPHVQTDSASLNWIQQLVQAGLRRLERVPLVRGVLAVEVTPIVTDKVLRPEQSLAVYSGPGANVITLPPANAAGPGVGSIVLVMNTSAASITVAANGTDKINNAANVTLAANAAGLAFSDAASRWGWLST